MEYSHRTLKCTPERLVKDLKFLERFWSVPDMDNTEELIDFIRGFGYNYLRGKKSIKSADNKQLFAVAHAIYHGIYNRLELYHNDLEKVLSNWNLNDGDKNIILDMNRRLKDGLEDKESLEERLCIQLERLPLNYPLMELFKVLSKNY